MTASAFPRESASPSRPAGWWGMVWLVATEATLFGVFFASYYYLRFQAPVWPPEGIPEPKILAPSYSAGILVASSVPMALAASARGRRSRRLGTACLAVAFVLGSVFLWLQAAAYGKLVDEHVPQDGAYSSLFYLITGAHAVHVFAGLALVLGTLLVVWTGVYGRRSRIAVSATALYWHFVNALAISVLVLVYLVPTLS
ncbi:MAG: cytochrome c oxidase subunit 3 [Gaiellaceae bacterium]